MLHINLLDFLEEKKARIFILCVFYKGKSWNFSEIHFETPSIHRRNFEFGGSVSYR